MKAILDSTGTPFRKKTRSHAPMLHARYDSAQTTHENTNHWANSDGLSADAANSPSVRQTLRNRARYEVANNCYANGILRTMAGDMIGTGPRLQLTMDDKELALFIEDEFHYWMKQTQLTQKATTMRNARGTDGEAFAVFTTNPNLKSRVMLDWQLVEAEMVTSPYLTDASTRRQVDGISFDIYGNPEIYDILPEHPGSNGFATYEQPIPVPADQVIHWFRADRPGQRRGISEFTPVLRLFSLLRRWTLAVITAAELSAELTLYLTTNTPPVDTDDDEFDTGNEQPGLQPMDLYEVERGTSTALPHGYDVKQLKPEQPHSTYIAGKRAIVSEVGRGLNIPYIIASLDAADYNYASGRLDLQNYRTMTHNERNVFELVAMDRTFEKWLQEARLVYPEVDIPQAVSYQWYWDQPEHVDPMKVASARDRDLRNGSTTIPNSYAAQNLDWEKEQLKAAESYGMTIEDYRAQLAKATFANVNADYTQEENDNGSGI